MDRLALIILSLIIATVVTALTARCYSPKEVRSPLT